MASEQNRNSDSCDLVIDFLASIFCRLSNGASHELLLIEIASRRGDAKSEIVPANLTAFMK